jgi:glutamate transport system permease protein
VEEFTSDPGAFFEAFWTTIKLTVYSGIGALIIGTVLAAMRWCPC